MKKRKTTLPVKKQHVTALELSELDQAKGGAGGPGAPPPTQLPTLEGPQLPQLGSPFPDDLGNHNEIFVE